MRALKIFAAVFIVHLVLILLTCWIVYSAINNDPNYMGEASLIWQFFLGIDFPASIPVMFTSGAAVVSVPESLLNRGVVFCDVIWPGFVFQILGTINWFCIIYFWPQIKRLFGKKIV